MFPYDGKLNEDVYFSNHMIKIKAKLPDFKTACSFSCELIPTTEIPLGVHKFVNHVKCLSLYETFNNHFTLSGSIP